jgi:hypothetical protein
MSKTRPLGRGVYLPHALSVKYPSAGRELGWQWVFPSEPFRRPALVW